MRLGLQIDEVTEEGMEEGMTVGDFMMRKYLAKRRRGERYRERYLKKKRFLRCMFCQEIAADERENTI